MVSGEGGYSCGTESGRQLRQSELQKGLLHLVAETSICSRTSNQKEKVSK